MVVHGDEEWFLELSSRAHFQSVVDPGSAHPARQTYVEKSAKRAPLRYIPRRARFWLRNILKIDKVEPICNASRVKSRTERLDTLRKDRLA